MTTWSRCHGAVLVPKASGFNLRNFVEQAHSDVTWRHYAQSTHNSQTLHVEFDFLFNLGGMPAAEFVEHVDNVLTSLPGYTWSRVECEIRFT